TVVLTAGGTLHVSAVETVSLNAAGDDLIVDDNTAVSVTAGAGADTVLAGDDLFRLTGTGTASLVAIDGGSGADTIALASAGTVDLAATAITNVEALS